MTCQDDTEILNVLELMLDFVEAGHYGIGVGAQEERAASIHLKLKRYIEDSVREAITAAMAQPRDAHDPVDMTPDLVERVFGKPDRQTDGDIAALQAKPAS
ncbi:hypothetical protein [Microbaculum marinum]|uniref:Uncharacterized protein n=1 Tax=Microbaculum marinum TaxID=1764581 RepID=A0AAW9RQJ3_9HYPH